ncbi:hypothetical protein D0Z08_19565 [Nocardioides immobilis]|uniref:Uncharacterized protein n=1 Tax=Nocardioides immobilis TaxID=2049295 RepID=A0A417XYI5_9ACTN|nr:hypothetical protein [Nocardioides immobilis]RHW25427.1 hypothetical protein D0Z08_19565 [Nocardioides immobilis]
MSARTSYDDVVSAAAAALADFGESRSAIGVQWQDGAARRAEVDLQRVADQMEALRSAVERQSQVHAQVDELCDLVARQVDEGDARIADAQELLDRCEEALRSADRIAGEVGSALSAGESGLARALALAGRAGAGTGSIVGVEALEARIRHGVGGRYQRQAGVMMAKAVGVELAWALGPELFSAGARVDLPQGWDSGIRDAVETAAPVVPAQISEVVRRFRDVWRR